MRWSGVMPAITTPFREDLSVDVAVLERQIDLLLERGASALVPLGSLGEGATLELPEKREILEVCVRVAGGRAPIMPGIAAASTAGAVRLAGIAADAGCGALMILPPWVYLPDWTEARAHVEAVLAATDLPCMLYNNPIAYGTDFRPEQIAELLERHPRLGAVKESSGDVRRVAAIRALAGDRVAVFAGLDDLVLECVEMGATGWIAGLVNALPEESVRLFDLAVRNRRDEAWELYRWFLPLLRLDTRPKFVQAIKLVQAELGRGTERVRPPRLPLAGAEREEVLATIRTALANRPGSPGASS